MNKKMIKLSTPDEAKELVFVARRCNFDVDISNGSMRHDAKSILGVMCFVSPDVLQLEYDGIDSRLEKVIQSFQA